jgi:polysaccharide export outer membrane protein
VKLTHRALAPMMALASILAPFTASGQGVFGERRDQDLRPRGSASEGIDEPTQARERLFHRDLGASLPGPVDPDHYVIGPGDIFELNFSGGVSTAIPIVVGPEGTSYVPGWGLLRLSGLTISQAREEVRKLLAGGLRGVRWDLSLRSVRQMRIYLSGDVVGPGPMSVPATFRLADALLEERLLPTGTKRNVKISRLDGGEIVGDLELFRRAGRQDLNPVLLDGDVIHVAPAVDFVEIWGAVAHPGRYELGSRDSLLTLFRLCGGPLPATLTENALLVQWRSPTDPESVFFDIEDVYRRTFNPPLREGEHVYVYFLPAYHELFSATILGEVNRPGTFPIALGSTRISDLVISAGGFRERANMSAIRLLRSSSLAQGPDVELDRLSRLSRSDMTSSEYEVLRTRLAARREDHRVDWSRLRQNPELDILMSNGDIVFVDPVLASIRVEGEVRRPGLVDFDARARLQDYVQLAGGYTNRADRRKLLVTRAISGQTVPFRDVQTLVPGDMVWVPTRPDRTVWDHLQTFIAVGAQLATVYIAVDAATR